MTARFVLVPILHVVRGVGAVRLRMARSPVMWRSRPPTSGAAGSAGETRSTSQNDKRPMTRAAGPTHGSQ